MKHAIICSISPIFGSDLLTFPPKKNPDLSLLQYKEMSKMRYLPLATKRVTVFYGEKEYYILKNRSIKLGKRKGYRTIKVRGADHELNQTYIEEIAKVL